MKGTIRNRGTERMPNYQVLWWIKDPATGKRAQRTKMGFKTKKAAQAHLSKQLVDVDEHRFVDRSKKTFREYADGWIEARSRRVRTQTAAGYASALKHATDAFGAKPLQQVDRVDVERIVRALVAAGRTRRTVSFVLFVVRSVLEEALHEGLISRNPAVRVEATGAPSRTRDSMAPAELALMYRHLTDDRLHALWLLTLAGMRRSEVMGLRWSHVDLAACTLTVAESRVDVTGGTESNDPKTRRGLRTISVPDDMLTALRKLREVQAAEFGFEQVRSGFLAIDEGGEPYRAERWSNAWLRHCREAGVRPCTLHAARHTSVTTMRRAGVPDHVIAQWHGHDEVVMRRTYTHVQQDELASAGRALSAALQGRDVAR